MTSQQPNPDNSWQWDDSQWDDTLTAPTGPEQVPNPDDAPDGWSLAVRRLLRWAAR